MYICARPEIMQIHGKGKRGHGGICLFVRDTIAAGVEVTDKNPNVGQLCKPIFGFHDDLFFCFCFIPPKDFLYFKNVDINLFEVLERDICHYSVLGKTAVVGDPNSRTGLSCDHFEGNINIDKNINCLEGQDLFENYDMSVGRKFSLDTKIDSSGVSLLQVCKACCLRILNGRVGDDSGIGIFTLHLVMGKALLITLYSLRVDLYGVFNVALFYNLMLLFHLYLFLMYIHISVFSSL